MWKIATNASFQGEKKIMGNSNSDLKNMRQLIKLEENNTIL